MDLAEILERAERQVWSDERGSIEFVRIRDGVALLVMSGKLGDEAGKGWEKWFPWLLGRDKPSLFLDGTKVTLPNAAFISAGTTLIKEARPRLDELHVLIEGGLLEMIAKTANLALGGMMRITRDRDKFEAELRRALGA